MGKKRPCYNSTAHGLGKTCTKFVGKCHASDNVLCKMGRLKMQDWKMADESARLENDGLENDLFLRHRLGVVLELRCR